MKPLAPRCGGLLSFYSQPNVVRAASNATRKCCDGLDTAGMSCILLYQMSQRNSSTPGQVLRAIRDASEVTQMKLAIHMGVSLRTVQRWEKDELRPSAAQVFELADFFGIEPRDLVDERSAA